MIKPGARNSLMVKLGAPFFVSDKANFTHRKITSTARGGQEK